MAVTTPGTIVNKTLQKNSAKTGSHTHTCYYGHSFTCSFVNSCQIEQSIFAHKIIDEMCPKCICNQWAITAS